jgi:transposase
MYDDVSELLGLERFRVTAVREEGDSLALFVELPREEAACTSCGVVGAVVKERPLVRVRDLAIAGRATVLAWRKRRFRCRACGRSFSERHPALRPRQRVSVRFRSQLARRAAGGGAHAEIARLEQTSRYQVGRALALQALPLARGRAPRRWLALDEAAHRRGWGRLVTVVSCPERRCVLEVLPGQGRGPLERYLRALTPEARAGIGLVSIDPSEAFRAVVRARLPQARIVVDPFHLVRGANEALVSVHRQRRRAHLHLLRGGSRAERGRTFRARHRLLKGRERLRPEERRELSALFEGGLPFDLPCTRPRRSGATAGALPRLERAGGAHLLQALRGPRGALARGAARLLRRAGNERLRRGGDKQDQDDQAPRLWPAQLHQLPRTDPHSMCTAAGHPRLIGESPHLLQLSRGRARHC